MTNEEAIEELKRDIHNAKVTHHISEHYEMAIKALEKKPCEDCISREEACDYIAEFVNHEYATDREREMIKHIIGGIQHLPSIQPTTKENLVVEDCISRKQAMKACYQMAVRTGIEEMPYKYAETELAHLPSIQPKTGHWVSKHIVDDCNGVVTWYECSECGRSVDETVTEKFMLKDYPYCHCGARMLPTDSEKE